MSIHTDSDRTDTDVDTDADVDVNSVLWFMFHGSL